jgi:hypothetical protein
VLPQGRRFEALGPAVGQELPALPALDAAPRAIADDDEA